MHPNSDYLRETIVGLADLVREVSQHGRTARFDSRAPGLLEEAREALRLSALQARAPQQEEQASH
jgi:hypothetical protein